MKIFVYEYCSAQPATDPTIRALRPEGQAMLHAILADFAAIPGVRPITLIADELSKFSDSPEGAQETSPGQRPKAITTVALSTVIPDDTNVSSSRPEEAQESSPGQRPGKRQPKSLSPERAQEALASFHGANKNEKRAFYHLAAEADFTLVIAPETGGILEQRCQWVLDAGGQLLGSPPAVIRQVADKLNLFQRLKEKGIPTPPTLPLAEALNFPFAGPIVVKPRRGAGSLANHVVRTRRDLTRFADLENAQEMIVQPYIPGQPASIAMLVGPTGQSHALLPAEQTLSDDGRLRYLGGAAPLNVELSAIAIRLARRAVCAFPGLLGYVGVDLVLTKNGGHVIEINPRLTTSYLGLRALSKSNLAAAMLDVAQGRRPSLIWKRHEKVSWTTEKVIMP